MSARVVVAFYIGWANTQCAKNLLFFRSVVCPVPWAAVPWLRAPSFCWKASVGPPAIASVSDDTETSLPTLLSFGGVDLRVLSPAFSETNILSNLSFARQARRTKTFDKF